MKLGIVGLPNVGKSTLFNSLTKAGAAAANYPFCTIEPNVGIVPVPDERLAALEKFYNAKSVVPAVIEFVDIAGLVCGASKGEGLGNKFLSHIREVDAIVHVVRCFDDSNVVHVEGSVDPLRDIETINIELIFADMEVLERRIAKGAKLAKSDRTAAKELEISERIKTALEQGKLARALEFSPEEEPFVKSLSLLTYKPTLFAANVSETELSGNEYTERLKQYAVSQNNEFFIVCAKIEEEISSFSDDEKALFLEELGVAQSGLDQIITASYKTLGLMSFLTAGEKEVRAWTIPIGTKAPAAAGKIHTDFERGFIRAEIVSFADLMRLNSYTACKEAGLVRLEGKDYTVKDGDVILFRFNV